MNRPGDTAMPRRRPMIRVVLLLAALAEVLVAITVGRLIGPTLTVLALFVLSVTGVLVLRSLGRLALRGYDPSVTPVPTPTQLGELATVATGGLLLAVPGLISGALGLLLVVPGTRQLLKPLLGQLTGPATARLLRAAGVQVVEGEVVTVGEPGERDLRVEVVEVRDAEVPPTPPPGPAAELPATPPDDPPEDRNPSPN